VATIEQAQESPARRRVLDTATALFYAEGVHAVGIDRIIAAARVAKATFYHHFPAKDDLVRAYLAEQYAGQRRAMAALRDAADPPHDTLLKVFDFLGDIASGSGFRGCPFINAAAEYPDRTHPVRKVVAEHRRWTRTLFRDLLAAAGHPHPDQAATILMMIRDGIVIGSDLDDSNTIRTRIHDAVAGVLGR
jgi:AcrR family transcriptional regulator